MTAHESGYSAIMLALLSGLVLYIYSVFYLMLMGWVLSQNPDSFLVIAIEGVSKQASAPLIKVIELVAAIDDKDPILSPKATALSFFFSFVVFFATRVGKKNGRNDSFDKKYNEKAHLHYGGPLEELFITAKNDGWPLLITLKTGKSYVCYVRQLYSFFPHQKENFIRCLVVASGYRTQDEMALKLVNRYDFMPEISNSFAQYMNELKQEEGRTSLKPGEKIRLQAGRKKLEIEHELLSSVYDEGFVINLDEITSATVWSEDIYQLFAETVKPGVSHSKPSPAKKSAKKKVAKKK